MKLHDQLNRFIELDKIPERIVSLVPSQTELLVDLGLRHKIVGVTGYCVHPSDIRKEKTLVGGTKGIRYDRIRDLNPDIILCNKEENTKEIVDKLSADFTLHISNVFTLTDTYNLIKQYGKLFDVENRAAELSGRIKKEAEDFKGYIADKPRLKVAYFIWREPWMVVGGQTFVNHLLELNNFKNVYADIPRYPEVPIDNLKEADVLLLSSEPYPFREEHKAELEDHVPHTRIEFVDGEFFSWYGSRLQKAFRYFKAWREDFESSNR